MKKTILFTTLLTALLLAGCTAGAPTTPPVSEHDVLLVTSQTAQTSVDAGDITPDVPQGIYVTGEEPAQITFAREKSGTLRYTDDCSTPTKDSPSADKAVPLNYEATGDGASEQAILRCALFDGDTRVSDVHTFVYTRAAADRYNMPVVNIVSDRDNLYGHVNGILVPGKIAADVPTKGNPTGWQAWYDAANYYMRGREWERPVSLTVFGETGELRLSQNCGVRASGGYTRYNVQKSLRVYARKDYSPSSGVFPYAFWGNLRGSRSGTPVSFSDTVLFRGGSNNENSTLFTTPCLLLLLEGTYLDAPGIQTVAEYINGKYKGVITQMEDFDEDYFLAHYGVEKENLTTMKGSVGEVFEMGGWRIDDGPTSEKQVFTDLLKFLIRQDMSLPENYAKACEMLDIRNFIEHMAFQSFIGNTDWPQNNMRAWRYNGNDTEGGYNPDAGDCTDGRWRFLTKDLDLSFGFRDGSKSADPYEYLNGDCGLLMRNVWRSLMKNEEFADLYYSYMCTLAGDVITPERCGKIFDLMQVYTGREIAYTTKLGVATGSRGNWNANFERMRKVSVSRPSAVLKYTRSHSGRTLANVTVNVTVGWNRGTVQLGWYDIENGASREYLRDTRIPLNAIPRDENTLVDIRVEGGTIDEDGYLRIDGTCTVTVMFLPIETEEVLPSAVVLNEVKFRGDGTEWVELYNPTEKAVRLSGYALGKEGTAARAQVFADTVIDAGGYALVCCTDFSNSDGVEGLRVPLSLGNGDTLTLFDGDGEAVDEILLETAAKTVHLGRYPDGGEVIPMSPAEITPGAANVRLDYEGGFVSENFEPYILAWGRAYDIDDYFYDKNGELYVKRVALRELCVQNGSSSELALYLKKAKEDIPLAKLLADSAEMDGASVRYVAELASYIIG